MNSNADFIKHGEKILDFLDNYGAVRLEHIEKFFPSSKKIIAYLIKDKRLHNGSDGAYISSDPMSLPDKRLNAALGVVTDVYDKVKSYAKGAEPTQISFVTHAGDYYEIIYVSCGMETMVAATLEAQVTARTQGNNNDCNVKRIIIIEDKSQMDMLQISYTTSFALVSPDGGFNYFKRS